MSTTGSDVMLEVRQLNKRFGGVHAVKDLTFEVRKGEVFGFLGPNGAGKTTTMKMVTCLVPPTSGAITVDSLSTTDRDLDIRKKLGYLPETNPLYNDMLVGEYLRYVGEIREMSGQQLTSRLDEMFALCGLTKMTHRPIGKLSKGYRQRVGLAQALLHNPDLLILDEPTSGLDPNQIVEIRQLIKNIGKQKTVIYCSHILSEVSATCSRILIINNGSSVATGTPDELTAHMGTGNFYTLKIKGDKNAIQSRLSGVHDVINVTVAPGPGDWQLARISSEGTEDIGEAIFRCVVDAGFSLAELKRESASLEEVFTKLTKGLSA